MKVGGDSRTWTRRRLLACAAIVVGASAAAAGVMSPRGQQIGMMIGNRFRNRMGIAPDQGPARSRIAAMTAEAPEAVAERTRVVVRKGERRLDLLDGEQLLKSYRIALGGRPAERKERKGDNATPEGEYRICTRLAQSRYRVFMGLNYPNAKDAESGRQAGIIGAGEHAAIVEAEHASGKPSWETAMGGAIGIHGSGSQGDWTLGCIALNDPDVDEVWMLTRMGTKVTILP